MATWMVTLEGWDRETDERRREAFEVTPPPEPGRERSVLDQLVHGIHAGAAERSYDGAVALFHDGPRQIAASFTVDGRPPVPRYATVPDPGDAVRAVMRGAVGAKTDAR